MILFETVLDVCGLRQEEPRLAALDRSDIRCSVCQDRGCGLWLGFGLSDSCVYFEETF